MPGRVVAAIQSFIEAKSCILPILVTALLLPAAHAQNNSSSSSLPLALLQSDAQIHAPTSANSAIAPPLPVSEALALRSGLVCGTGTSISSVATKPTTQCGALFGLGYLETEVGVMGPQANRSKVSGYLSQNVWLPLRPKRRRGSPVAVGGYTRMFETGHAIDFGLAYIKPIGPAGDLRYIQFEARDYWTFANPNQHNAVFRVLWLWGSGDEP